MLGLDAAGKTSMKSVYSVIGLLTRHLYSDIIQVEVEPVCYDDSHRRVSFSC